MFENLYVDVRSQLHFFTGLIMSVVVYLMLLSEDYKFTGQALKYCFEFIPHFTITYAFTRFSYLVLSNNQCKLKKSFCNSIYGKEDLCCRKCLFYFSPRYQLYIIVFALCLCSVMMML
jgi:hypothetical protein